MINVKNNARINDEVLKDFIAIAIERNPTKDSFVERVACPLGYLIIEYDGEFYHVSLEHQNMGKLD